MTLCLVGVGGSPGGRPPKSLSPLVPSIRKGAMSRRRPYTRAGGCPHPARLRPNCRHSLPGPSLARTQRRTCKIASAPPNPPTPPLPTSRWLHRHVPATRGFVRTVAALLIFVLLLYQLLYSFIRVRTTGGGGGGARIAEVLTASGRPTPGRRPTGLLCVCNLSRKNHNHSNAIADTSLFWASSPRLFI